MSPDFHGNPTPLLLTGMETPRVLVGRTHSLVLNIGSSLTMALFGSATFLL